MSARCHACAGRLGPPVHSFGTGIDVAFPCPALASGDASHRNCDHAPLWPRDIALAKVTPRALASFVSLSMGLCFSANGGNAGISIK